MNVITRSSKASGAEGMRNRFFARKRMLAEDFQIEQDYFINSQRLINRAILGWGIVYGFKIEGATPPSPCGCEKDDTVKPPAEYQPPPATDQAYAARAKSPATDQGTPGEDGSPVQEPAAFPLEVGPGFALDRGGRHVVLRKSAELTPENTVLLIEKSSGWVAHEIDGNLEPGHYVLAAHYTESKAGGVVSASLCCCGDPERTHVCEGVIFSFRKTDCPCGEPDCPSDGLCVCDGCCEGSRGPHARLAAWATARQDHLAVALCDWRGVMVALGEPVDLACVVVDSPPDKCRPISVSLVDESTPRRLVKTSDTLYDLLNGCDLTHIEDVSWRDWHRNKAKMPWKTFAEYFTHDPASNGGLQTNFVVRFSAPVDIDSIRRDVIAISVQMADGGTGWIRSRRLPLRDPDSTPSTSTLPPGMTDQFRVTVDRRWIRDEIDTEGESYLSERDFVVEIEIRGDLIVDCSGQTVDANTQGLSAAPSGNGTPGGSYFSTFMVQRMERPATSGDEGRAA